MSASFKTPEQVEFADLVARARDHGYKQSHVAKELGISRAAVSMYLKGTSNPSNRTLEDLKDLVRRLEQATEPKESPESPESNLKHLKTHAPHLYRAAGAAIQALRDQAGDTSSDQKRRANIAAEAVKVNSESLRIKKKFLDRHKQSEDTLKQ